MRLACLALLLGGCLSGNFNGTDMSKAAAKDLAVPGPVVDMTQNFVFDLTGFDLAGLYNCQQLNMCDQGKTAAGVLMCSQMATPAAQAKEGALQNCFVKYCPVTADMGMGRCAVIDADAGTVSADCMTCINNTYVAMNGTCTPANAPECHLCLTEAN